MNKHGNCGPHLDRKQMQHLPDHFGPGPVNSVLQQVVQSCIDCAYQPKVLLSALQTHSGGGEIVRGRLRYTKPILSSHTKVTVNGENSQVMSVVVRWAERRAVIHSVLAGSENRWRRPCGQAPRCLQCFFCAAVFGNHVSSSAMRQPLQQPAVQPLRCVRQDQVR